MRHIATFVFALACAGGIAPLSAAPTIGGPATGLWAHPGDGGRGFNIDIQGDTMVVTTFIYTHGGDPIWYLSSGTYDHGTGRFQSSYDSYSDGQCFGCPAQSPIVHSGAAGPMSIQFHSNQTATLSTPNGSLEIAKFNYGFPSLTSMLYGEWVFSLDVGGLVSGDWIVFDQPYTASDGTVYAAGHSDDSMQNVALGTYSSDSGGFVVLAEEAGGFEHFYVLDMDDHRGFGAGWVTQSGQTPGGNGSPAVVGRVLYQGELVPLNGAAAARTGSSSVDQAALVTGGDAVTPVVAAAIGRAREALHALQGTRLR